MANQIGWCDETWNPITGCSPVSEGCENCYAARFAKRLRGRAGYPEDEPFRVTLHKDKLDVPFGWKRPRRVFVCSMGDLFHGRVATDDVYKVFALMGLCARRLATRADEKAYKAFQEGDSYADWELADWHTFLVLTKRPRRALELLRGDRVQGCVSDQLEWMGYDGEAQDAFYDVGWPLPNVWLGVTAENQQRADERIPILLQTPAAHRFVSCEPLLGPVDAMPYLHCPFCGGRLWVGGGSNMETGESDPGEPCVCTDYGRHDLRPTLDLVIAGPETGPGARPMNPAWLEDLKEQCEQAGVPFYNKQTHKGDLL